MVVTSRPAARKAGTRQLVKRHAVEPDRAGAAIALVAALLDAEPAVLAQEGAQALAGRRLGRELLPLTVRFMLAASSARICSA